MPNPEVAPSSYNCSMLPVIPQQQVFSCALTLKVGSMPPPPPPAGAGAAPTGGSPSNSAAAAAKPSSPLPLPKWPREGRLLKSLASICSGSRAGTPSL